MNHATPPNFLGAFGLAAAAGLNATLPLLLIGVLARAGLVTLTPPFDALATTTSLVALSGLVLLELIADKVPGLDHSMHAILFPLSVTAGAILFGTQTHAVAGTDPGLQVVLSVLVGGGTAGVAHSLRAALRPVTHVFLLGSLVSLGEDLTAGSLTFAALYAPWLIPFMLVGLLISLFLTARMLYRMLRRKSGSFFQWLGSQMGLQAATVISHDLDEDPESAADRAAIARLEATSRWQPLTVEMGRVLSDMRAALARFFSRRYRGPSARGEEEPSPPGDEPDEDEVQRARAAWFARRTRDSLQ